jgi:uncharacterized protein (TIGR00730 family)
MKIKSLAVFCGSKSGNNSVYEKDAKAVGEMMAQNNVTVIYGGGGVGIMKAVADAVMSNGGKVIGVIPKLLLDWEHQHKEITELIVVDDMHSRKKKLYELCDSALILPGGFGTLDELFEMLTWNQLSIHSKKIFILNSGGFYNHLIEHLYQLEKDGFLYNKLEERITILNNVSELIPYIL